MALFVYKESGLTSTLGSMPQVVGQKYLHLLCDSRFSLAATVSISTGTVHEPSNPNRNHDQPTKKSIAYHPPREGLETLTNATPRNSQQCPSWWTGRESNTRLECYLVHFVPFVFAAMGED